MIEFSPYIHFPSGEVLTFRGEHSPLMLPPGDSIQLSIAINPTLPSIAFYAQTAEEFHELRLLTGYPTPKWVRQVSTWYGGNKPAPSKILIKKSPILRRNSFLTEPHGQHIQWGVDEQKMRLVLGPQVRPDQDDMESTDKS